MTMMLHSIGVEFFGAANAKGGRCSRAHTYDEEKKWTNGRITRVRERSYYVVYGRDGFKHLQCLARCFAVEVDDGEMEHESHHLTGSLFTFFLPF